MMHETKFIAFAVSLDLAVAPAKDLACRSVYVISFRQETNWP